MKVLLLLLSSIAFLTVIFYGVSAQSSAETCAQIARNGLPTKCSLIICCIIYEQKVNAYPDCYCSSFNSTDILLYARICGFPLPQNVTSCFPPGTYIHTYMQDYISFHVSYNQTGHTHYVSLNATPFHPNVHFMFKTPWLQPLVAYEIGT